MRLPVICFMNSVHLDSQGCDPSKQRQMVITTSSDRAWINCWPQKVIFFYLCGKADNSPTAAPRLSARQRLRPAGEPLSRCRVTIVKVDVAAAEPSGFNNAVTAPLTPCSSLDSGNIQLYNRPSPCQCQGHTHTRGINHILFTLCCNLCTLCHRCQADTNKPTLAAGLLVLFFSSVCTSTIWIWLKAGIQKYTLVRILKVQKDIFQQAAGQSELVMQHGRPHANILQWVAPCNIFDQATSLKTETEIIKKKN